MKLLAEIIFSNKELKAISIANSLSEENLSDEEYFCARVKDLANNYVMQHITTKQNDILLSALKVATTEDRAKVAASLNVDLEIAIVTEEKIADA